MNMKKNTKKTKSKRITMKTKSKITVVLLVLLGFTLTGCIHVNRQFKQTRNSILSTIEAEFERETEFGLGPVGLTVAKAALTIAVDEDEAEVAHQAIRQISEVQVGVYKITDRNYELTMLSFNDATENLRKKGWIPIVRNSSHGELNMIFIRKNEKEIKDIYVIALDNDELAIVNVHGRLDKLVAIGLQQGKLEFEHSSHHH